MGKFGSVNRSLEDFLNTEFDGFIGRENILVNFLIQHPGDNSMYSRTIILGREDRVDKKVERAHHVHVLIAKNRGVEVVEAEEGHPEEEEFLVFIRRGTLGLFAAMRI